ncbi:MAG: hypothetical protein M3N12_00175, partial [Verrucomicrobiota bacterium]|nr:hypothetical protein [Verrucomicrobiota bacterium]
MKPNSQLSRQPGRLDEARSSSRPASPHPVTDYHFHAPASELQASRAASSHKLARPVFAPGFRDLSNEFLGAETKRSYVAEVLFFAVIVAVSAWPIVSMVQA